MIVDSAFFFLHVEVLIICVLYDQKLALVSGKLVNTSFTPRAFSTRAKRLATSLVAEARHVILPHSTKLSALSKFENFETHVLDLGLKGRGVDVYGLLWGY